MRMRRLAIYVLLLFAILAVLYVVPAAKATNFYEKALPPQLRTSGFVTSGSDYGLFGFLTLSREACGAVVFELSSETIAEIRRDGLSFFREATQGRGYPGSAYYHYQAWQQTPVPASWFGDGAVSASLHCAGFGRELRRRIGEGSRRGGSFYTTMSEAQLIVLPDEGIIVLTYFG